MTLDKLLTELKEIAQAADGRYGSKYENQWKPNINFHHHANPQTILTLIKIIETQRVALHYIDNNFWFQFVESGSQSTGVCGACDHHFAGDTIGLDGHQECCPFSKAHNSNLECEKLVEELG